MNVYAQSRLQLTGLAGPVYGARAGVILIPLYFDLPIAGPVPTDLDPTPQVCQEQNDGIQLVATILDQAGKPVNLRGSTVLQFKLLAPDGTAIDRVPTFLTNGADGALQYSTDEDDILQDGTWQLQAKFVLAGMKKTTQWAQFRVGANIDQA